MQIVRERPSQRRHHRVNAPLKITLPAGERVVATDWSIGGSQVEGIASPLPNLGDVMTLTYDLPFQGFDISFQVDAKVVRLVEETRTVAFEHLELSDRANDLMNHFVNDLIRGNMATVADTICRIDVPVTPISTKPDANPKEEVPARRWPIKTIVMSAFYLVLGVAVFGYIGVLVYSKTMRMEIRSAVVSQPLLTIKMPTDGLLVPVKLAQDETVRKGEKIARIVSAKLEAEIETKRSLYDQKLREQYLAKEKFRIESERMKLYQVINRTDLQIAKARVLASKEALAAADAAFERMAALKKKGLVDHSKYDEAAKRRNETQVRLEENEYELERAIAMESVSDRRYFNHKEFVADLDLLALDIEATNNQLTSIHREITKLEAAKEELTITAPFDGRIVAVKQPGNSTVLRDTDVLILEKTETPTVTAFLSQDEIMSVGLNDEAKIFLPATGREIAARVTRIDRNSSFIDTKKSHYVWNEGKSRTAAVSLSLDASELSEDVHAGMPAIVLFSKRSTSDIYNKFGSTVKTVTGAMADDSQV